MRPRHALAAAAILTAVTLGSWAALVADDRKPAAQAAEPKPAPVTAPSAAPDPTSPHVPDVRGPRPCHDGQAGLPRRPGSISRIAGDFDGDHARDQLLAYAELDAAGQPRQWHVRMVLATGGIADLALDNTSDWIGPGGLVARRAVDANGDGRDEGFVTSTGGASNDAYNPFTLDGCQLRQVRVASSGPLRFASAHRWGTPRASTARPPTGTADACSPFGASSARSTTPTAAPPTPGPGPATAGPPARWSARWTPPGAALG